MFRKNKIAHQINISNDDSSSQASDFDSLNVVKQRKKANSFYQRVIVKQHQENIEEFWNKVAWTKQYFKSNWLNLLKLWTIIMIVVSLFFGSFIAFSPHFSTTPGDVYTPVNNFYTAIYANSKISFSLTNIGIGFVVVSLITLILGFLYSFFASKHKSLFKTTDKQIKAISISAYICIVIAVLLLLLAVLIPPSINPIYLNGQDVSYYISQGMKGDEEAIKKLYELIDKPVPSSNLINQFKDDLLNGLFSINSNLKDSYSFIQNAYYYTQSSLNPIGITFVVLIVLLTFLSFVALPFSNFILGIKFEANISSEIKAEWNSFRIMIFGWFQKAKEKMGSIEKKKLKEKDTFKKYKKELIQKGISRSQVDEQFSSDNLDNESFEIVTKKEIESHEPNKPFLNNQGQWMYHDGEGKYFIVKNDNWVPFDIKAAQHASLVNPNIERENQISLSQRSKKQGKFNFSKDSSINIDLPDEELEKIMKEMDI